jgi:phage baseplate assembly protein W
MEKFLNIRYPFEDSARGFLVELNQTSKEAVKSDLLHLLFTDKGSRYYLPEFGTNLKKYLFNPNDSPTHDDIIAEIQLEVNTFIPGLKITNIKPEADQFNPRAIFIRIDFKIGEGIFEESDFVEVSIAP